MAIPGVRDQYTTDMAGLHLHLYQFSRLLVEKNPRVSAVLEGLGVEPFLYAAPWFLTLFAALFPLSFSLRIFDMVMMHGIVIIFRVAFILMAYCTEDIIACESFEEALFVVQKTLQKHAVKVDDIVKQALEYDLSVETLETLAAEYATMKEREAVFGANDPVVTEKIDNDPLLRALRDLTTDQRQEINRLKTAQSTLAQQSNHAKSAIHELRIENEDHQAIIARLMQENANLQRANEKLQHANKRFAAELRAARGRQYSEDADHGSLSSSMNSSIFE